MRDVEFLPDWYPQLRRRKRVALTQGWVLGLIVAGMGGWIALSQHNIRAAASTLTSIQRRLDDTRRDQTILSQQLELRKQLQQRQELIGSLGIPVEMTRLFETLDSSMPKEMSLVKFDSNIEETTHTVTSVAGVRSGEKPQQQVDRRLKVKLSGVAPSDVDLANFLANLTKIQFLDQVAVTYARNKVESGHVLREFEISFSMKLDSPAAN